MLQHTVPLNGGPRLPRLTFQDPASPLQVGWGSALCHLNSWIQADLWPLLDVLRVPMAKTEELRDMSSISYTFCTFFGQKKHKDISDSKITGEQLYHLKKKKTVAIKAMD